MQAGNAIMGFGKEVQKQQKNKLAAQDERDELRSMMSYLTDDPTVLEKFDSGSLGAQRGIVAQELALQSREERERQQEQAMSAYMQKADYSEGIRQQRMQQEDAQKRAMAAQLNAQTGMSSIAAKEFAKRATSGDAALQLAEFNLGKEEAAWLYDFFKNPGKSSLRNAPTEKAAQAAARYFMDSPGTKPKATIGKVATPDGNVYLDPNTGRQYRPEAPAPPTDSNGLPAGGGDVNKANPLMGDYYFD